MLLKSSLAIASLLLLTSMLRAEPPASKPAKPACTIVLWADAGTYLQKSGDFREYVKANYLTKPNPADKVNICCFSDQRYDAAANAPLPLTPENVDVLSQFLDRHSPAGANEGLKKALTEAIAQSPTQIILTGPSTLGSKADDKHAEDPKALAALILKSGAKLTVIDPSDNEFLKALAKAAKGEYVKLE